MNDDWRLEVDPASSGEEVVEQLRSRQLETDLDRAFGETVIVSHEGETLWLYAGKRDQIERARSVVERLAAENGWQVTSKLTRWHPDAEEWEDPDAPLPRDEDERAAERAEAIRDERAEVRADGEPVFEVRVELDSHREAAELAERLRSEGLAPVRRWKYLVIGAADEDEAKEIAETLRVEAPDGSEVTVEGSGRVAWAERPANPFAIFGGLGV